MTLSSLRNWSLTMASRTWCVMDDDHGNVDGADDGVAGATVADDEDDDDDGDDGDDDNS